MFVLSRLAFITIRRERWAISPELRNISAGNMERRNGSAINVPKNMLFNPNGKLTLRFVVLGSTNVIVELCFPEENDSVFDENDYFGAVWDHRYYRNTNQNRLFNGVDEDGLPLQSEECVALMVEKEHQHLPGADYLTRLKSGDLNFDSRKESVHWIGMELLGEEPVPESFGNATNRSNRTKLSEPHCTGTRSFPRIVEDLTIESNGIPPTRADVYVRSRTRAYVYVRFLPSTNQQNASRNDRSTQ